MRFGKEVSPAEAASDYLEAVDNEASQLDQFHGERRDFYTQRYNAGAPILGAGLLVAIRGWRLSRSLKENPGAIESELYAELTSLEERAQAVLKILPYQGDVSDLF
ncbi:MAG TPA: hypothetical protein VF572_01455 [Candidatus Saccharimonadales bacterium]